MLIYLFPKSKTTGLFLDSDLVSAFPPFAFGFLLISPKKAESALWHHCCNKRSPNDSHAHPSN